MLFARIARWVGRLTALGLIICAAVVSAQTRRQAVVLTASDQAVLQRDVGTLADRVAAIEHLDLGTKVTVLELNVKDLKDAALDNRRLLYGAVIGIVAQLIVATMQRKGRRA